MPSISPNSWFLEQVQRHQARLRAYEFDRNDPKGDFGGWVRQIARRLVANERRKATRRDLLLSDHATDLLLEMNREMTNPGELQEREEAIARLRVCVFSLPGRSRELLQ